MLPEDINNLYVRSANGEMVPFSTFSSSQWVYGSPRLERYNGMPSMELLGEAAPGRSTGEAMAMMESPAENCQPVSVMTGPVCLTVNACQVTVHLRCMPSR